MSIPSDFECQKKAYFKESFEQAGNVCLHFHLQWCPFSDDFSARIIEIRLYICKEKGAVVQYMAGETAPQMLNLFIVILFRWSFQLRLWDASALDLESEDDLSDFPDSFGDDRSFRLLVDVYDGSCNECGALSEDSWTQDTRLSPMRRSLLLSWYEEAVILTWCGMFCTYIRYMHIHMLLHPDVDTFSGNDLASSVLDIRGNRCHKEAGGD